MSSNGLNHDAVAPDILELLALALEPVVPSADTRSRLMNSVGGPDRFAPFVAALARLFDLPVDVIKGLVARIDDACAWAGCDAPGVRVIDFAAGPRVATAHAGFVRVSPGASFPWHRHLGHETTLVLAGTLVDGGREYGPGASVQHETDSIHDYVAGPGRDLVIAVLHGGLTPAAPSVD